MMTVCRAAQIDVADVGDLQAALDLLPDSGGTLHLPAGTHDLDRTVRFRLKEGQHLHIHGDGRASVLRFTATDGSPCMALDGVPDSWWPDLRMTIRDIAFVGTPQCGDALLLKWPNDALVDACSFQGFGGTAVTVTPNATNVTIRDCWMRDCKRALHADNLHHLTFHGNQTRSLNGGQTQREHLYIGRHCREVRIVNNHLAYGHAEGMILDGTAQHVIANNTIEGFTHGIRAVDCRDITVSSNYIHCPTGILLEADTRGIVVTGNIFTDNTEGAVRIGTSYGSGGHVITSNVIRQSVYNNGQRGIDLGDARSCVVTANVLEDLSEGEAVMAVDPAQHTLGGNQVTDCAQRARNAMPADMPACEPGNRYRALHDWLRAQPETCSRITLTQWEHRRLLGADLPREASEDTAWWANDPSAEQARAWLGAGWVVGISKRIEGRTVFARI